MCSLYAVLCVIHAYVLNCKCMRLICETPVFSCYMQVCVSSVRHQYFYVICKYASHLRDTSVFMLYASMRLIWETPVIMCLLCFIHLYVTMIYVWMMLRWDPYYNGIHIAFGYLGVSCSDDLHLCRSKLHPGPPKYSKCAIECSGF